MGFNPMFLIGPAATMLIGWGLWSFNAKADSAASTQISAAVKELTVKIEDLGKAIGAFTLSNARAEERHSALAAETGKIDTRVTRIETDLYHRAG